MPIPVTVPRLGWNMDEGTFVEWIKRDGDPVRPGDVVFRLEGEKAVEEVESLDSGVLSIPNDAPRPGDKVKVGATIAVLLQSGEVPPSAPPAAPPAPEPAASPSVRRLAREHGLNLSAIKGSGPGGRILPHDVKVPAPVAVTPRARRLAKQHGIDPATLCGSGKNGRVRARDIPVPQAAPAAPTTGAVPHTPVRRAIAARMTESLRDTAPVTLTSVVDATNLVNLRAQFKAVASESVPSYTDFLLKFAAVALQKHPVMTASWTDAGLVYPESINIGIAVDTDAGLLVPVIRDVSELGLSAVAARSHGLIECAKSGVLTTAEMRGGCFTITNLGAFGIDAFTPIINPPECAILGVGRIERRPVADGDRVAVREQLTLSLTFDHRIVDGAPAARFLQTIAECIRNPAPWVSS